MLRMKRTYEPPARGDGRRVLVERLWPRGVKKEALALDAWEKDLAPSSELRKWYGHRVERWEEFRRRYRSELDANPASWRPLAEASQRGTVTLLYSTHDAEHSGALVLYDYLLARGSASDAPDEPRARARKRMPAADARARSDARRTRRSRAPVEARGSAREQNIDAHARKARRRTDAASTKSGRTGV
jgi:uncharacterized protein YeaO (DUF488 family)